MAEIIFLGAGLANLLLAQRCKEKNPQLDFVILEERQSFYENRTWSFHESDLSPATWNWIKTFVSKEWDGYDLYFPKYSRALLGAKYASIKGDEFLAKLSVTEHIRWGQKVKKGTSQSVLLESGEEIFANKIIDGRGFSQAGKLCGYQKFLGQQILLKKPHGLDRPILMDATVEQTDGYRFFYLLPWSEKELLVEDTYYSNSPLIDEKKIGKEIFNYLSKKGFEIEKVLSEESSALPIPFFPVEIPLGHVIGAAAGLFHPTTGYSFPFAAELAFHWNPMEKDSLENLKQFSQQWKKSQKFYHLLNRMLFLAGEPSQRIKIFERFCGFSEPLIQRFYAGKSSLLDQSRILMGKPPVPIFSAIQAMTLSKGIRA
jgi:lycopene beta-cyclase